MRFRGDARMSPLRNEIWMCPELLPFAMNHFDVAPVRLKRSRLRNQLIFSFIGLTKKFIFKKWRACRLTVTSNFWQFGCRCHQGEKKMPKKLKAELCFEILLLHLFLTSFNAKLQKYNKNVKFMWNMRTVFTTPRVWIAWNSQAGGCSAYYVERRFTRRYMWHHCLRDMMSAVEIPE